MGDLVENREALPFRRVLAVSDDVVCALVGKRIARRFMKNKSILTPSLLVALSLATAWAIRGKFGHEQGAERGEEQKDDDE